MEHGEVEQMIEDALKRFRDELGALSGLSSLNLNSTIITALFTAYAPTVTTGAGVITALGAVSGRYCKIGRLVIFQVSIAITTNGAGATDVEATLPVAPAAFDYVVAGRAKSVSKKELQGFIPASGTKVFITNYDNTYPGADGEVIVISGCYESAT